MTSKEIELKKLNFYFENKIITKEEYEEKKKNLQEKEGEFEEFDTIEKVKAKYELLNILEKRKYENKLKLKQDEIDKLKQDHSEKLKKLENMIQDQKKELLDLKKDEKKDSGFLMKLFKKK